MLVSIVAPVHNEFSNLPFFYNRVIAAIASSNFDFEIIFVDDGSSDESFNYIKYLSSTDERVFGYRLSRNFGHQNAVTCGLHKAHGDAIIIIDSDLQDPPELIPDMIREWQRGFKNVYCVRTSREGETIFKKMTANLFYRVLSIISDYPIPANTGDFRLIDRTLLEALKKMNEDNPYLRGMIAWLGFPSTSLSYVRDARYSGTTSYTFKKMFSFSKDAIFSFSSKPLRLSTYLGGSGFLVSVILSGSILFHKLLNPDRSVPGYVSLMLAILLLGSLQLVSIGLIGEYLQRIFLQVKKRPLYVVDEVSERSE